MTTEGLHFLSTTKIWSYSQLLHERSADSVGQKAEIEILLFREEEDVAGKRVGYSTGYNRSTEEKIEKIERQSIKLNKGFSIICTIC